MTGPHDVAENGVGLSPAGTLTGFDRLVSLEQGARATAIRNVPNTLVIFDTHFPRFPVLPGVLILATMGSLAGRLLEEETTRPWRLVGADQVGFRHFVQPGDQLEIVVELKERGDEEAVLSAEARVDGKVVTRARRLRMAAESR
jgi:3-hydroxyacyl-[acyl-carrier-protein] dehydratase